MEHHEIALAPDQEHTFHVIPIKTFVAVFFALFVLMVATIAAAEFLHLNTYLMNAIARGIAITKATLVVMYFMGVKYATQLSKIYALAGFVWVTLMGITFCDYVTRKDEVAPQWLPGAMSPVTNGSVPELGKEAPRQYFGAR
jgi:cytochrome c oxidase subunit 4